MAINYLAVLVAAIAAYVLGFIWYNPKVFGTTYMKLSGLKKMEAKPAGIFLGFLATLLRTFVVAMIIEGFAIQASIITILWVWLGFMATTTLGAVIWEHKPVKFWILKNIYSVVELLLMVVILVLM